MTRSQPTDQYRQLRDEGIVAIVRGTDPDTAIDVVDALAAGGVSMIEITADTPGVLDMISDVAGSFGDEVTIGAGTVLDAETARSALLAGAEFLVTPTVDRDVVNVANRYGALVTPGVMTPTEALSAYEAGAQAVKVFPAGDLGPGHVASMKGPLGHVPMMPTGGVTLDNVGAFFEAGATAVGVGSSLVDSDAVAAGEFRVLTENAEAFCERIESVRLDP